ncbi:MAG: threonylcarbamoyl-AMP synthase [Candidatus Protistobacter heckmanni]|nr:threonylcarbamoyl-AMP synthase [Candidatus Protistobacter heckmanni]
MAGREPEAGADHAERVLRAARLLQAGELVAFPTETVYGLGADASDARAVAKIFAAKGRPSDHPVIVHVIDAKAADAWAAEVPPLARTLMAAFWPGPLTLILKRAAWVPPAVSGGQDSVGLRCPSHPLAQALLRTFADLKGDPAAGVAAPSANKFGKVSPTAAAHVRAEFPAGHRPPVEVLDGGPSDVGIESTILDLSRLERTGGPVLLRPGGVSARQIAEACGVMPLPPDVQAPRASGTLTAHYAPSTPLYLADSKQIRETLAALAEPGYAGGKLGLVTHAKQAVPDAAAGRVIRALMLADPAGYAHALYATLREMDALGLERILVERPPADAGWDGVNDRLGRAAAAFEGT